MRKTSPFKPEKYCSRTKRIQNLNRPGSFWERKWLSTISVLIFAFIDFWCLKTAWNVVQTEDSFYINCTAIACAMALDFPLALAAIAIKKCHQGLISKKEKTMVLIPALLAFALAFSCNFAFRVTTRDNSFEISSASNLTNTAAITEAGSKTQTASDHTEAAHEIETGNGSEAAAVLFAGIYSGIIPLLTSISSFVISYFSCTPLEDKLARLERERVGLQSHIDEVQGALSETRSSEELCTGLAARENDLFQEFLGQLDANACSAKQLVRILLMEKLKTPEDITALSESSQKLAADSQAGETPAHELPVFLDTQISQEDEEEKVVPLFPNHVA